MKDSEFWTNYVRVRHGRRVCWEWTKNRSTSGYGKLLWRGKHMRAHRVSWILHNERDIPEGMVIMHVCDNPPCMNPRHLRPGTLKENSEDMVRKGRARGGSPPGEGHGKAKLTDGDVIAIRLLHEEGYSYRRLGRMFGLSHQNTRLAALGVTWKHIGG